MSSLVDIARLNVLIELFSESANAADLETLLRIVVGRLRWIIEFDECMFVLTREEGRICWIGTRRDETLRRILLTDLHENDATLIESVLESGAPAARPPGRMCIPVQAVGRTFGAIGFSTDTGVYSYRDMRLGHHAGQYLGSLISRMDLEEETKRFSKSKDDLLALLSHELRNPLAPIVTAVQLLKMRDPGQQTKELDIIERQAKHLVRLVDDLLDIARLTRGKMVLQRAPVELAQVVARALEMVSPLFQQRGHALDIDVPSVGLIVDADENRLAQVLSNLMSNAAHYTQPGGHVRIAAHQQGQSVVIEVSDDGIGIAAAALSNIFDLFVQGPNRSGAPGGLGLGLVVVKHLTELHGGSVSVASEGDGRGAKFTVRLPCLPAGTMVAAASAGSLLPRTDTPQRVLLVDDNEDALDLLSALVERAGHEVVVAHDGLEALAALERFQPSVAVVDIGMPVMDGYELAARIRTQHGGARVYLLALTGYGQPADRARGSAAGFDGHLVKPVDLAHLLRLIAGVHVHAAESDAASDMDSE
jgi:signal transduction histidine kinase/ActR/RegA family two-component response regulator